MSSTDYDFPEMWGRMTDEQKCQWFTRQRVYRQAIRQDTAFGRRHQRDVEREKDKDYRIK